MFTGAVDIGGTKTSVGVVSESGQLVARFEWPTPSMAHPEDATAAMATWFASASAGKGVVLSGIGVGCTGPIDPTAGIVGNVDLLPGWTGFSLAKSLSQKTGLPVAVENDADAGALAEVRWGAGRGAVRFLYITVSTGIGAGIVFDNQLYRGVGGAHPEIGHFSLDPNGPLCYCGATGCWEALASGMAMIQWARAHERAHAIPQDWTARELCAYARLGDPRALPAVRQEAEWLGLGIANLVTLFCPDVIALGGGVMESFDLFFDTIARVVQQRCTLVPSQKVKIVQAAFGKDAALMGAALVGHLREGIIAA